MAYTHLSFTNKNGKNLQPFICNRCLESDEHCITGYRSSKNDVNVYYCFKNGFPFTLFKFLCTLNNKCSIKIKRLLQREITEHFKISIHIIQ